MKRSGPTLTNKTTIRALLNRGRDNAVAIAAPGRKPLTYTVFRSHVDKTALALRHLGVGPNDPVAIVLPNGPEMASAFVSVAAAATAAPLNPAYREKEFEFYLSDLNAKLLILQRGIESPARAVADKLGIEIAELSPKLDDAAGLFELTGKATGAPKSNGLAISDDFALFLHTSGTTSRPKIVPLTHGNICKSAANISQSLRLERDDCCLNIMPLFHIHGLVAAVLSSLNAGATVFCTPGFNGLKFFAWLREANPTWYTAVPTMHQAILGRAMRHQNVLNSVRLRFLRSSSAALAPQVMQALEKTFGVPVIEAYGMTEAAHQMASNPLPPQVRKPGTVGIPAGPEVAIMDDQGTLLPFGEVGEVVIRGANVANGYQNNPEANASAFINGWFRTGDLGIIDHQGYLRLAGRLKEIINRGGEKISPREVDEVLLDHPAVAQAVTFAVPHEQLGEDVAAAIVLAQAATATESEIRDFARGRLAAFKIPRQVIFLDEIPKGPTGKLQRIGLAERLGLA